MNYLVSRHAGALDWMQRRIPDATSQPQQVLTHLPSDFTPGPGDRVYGVLPLNWVERIHHCGAQAWVLEMDLTPDLRGQELSAVQLDQLDARLVRYEVFARETLA